MKKIGTALGVLILIFLICTTIFFFNKPETFVTVTFIGENNEVLNQQTVERGSIIDQWDPENTIGFIGWFKEDNTAFDFSTQINQNITLYAQWREIEKTKSYTITFLVDNEFYMSLLVIENEVSPLPEEPIKEGHTFIGWYENNEPFNFSRPITKEHTLTAVYE